MSVMSYPWAAAPGGPAPAGPPGRLDSLLWATLPVLGVLLLGALALYLADRYRKRASRRTSPAGDQLAHFRSLYERGQMSREEFDKVRDLLAEQLRREMDLGPARPGQSPPSAGTTPPPSPPRLPLPPPDPGHGAAGNGEAGNRLA